MSRLPITRPDLGDSEIDAAARVIRSGWVSQGPEVAAFEREFAAAVGAPFAVALSNCTVALELSLRALGVGDGDEVVTVSHSFIATANSIRAVGATPVFVDVEEDTYGMDPTRLADAFSERTRAVLCVHQLGIPCDLAAIVAASQARGVPVIEDAACAIGSEVEWEGEWARIGRPHGTVACFSFHARKVVTTGDGGMLTTANPELDAHLRRLRQHGMSIPDTVRHGAGSVVFEEYLEPAYNGRMTDVQAALGRPQIRRLDAIVRRRRDLGERLDRHLERHRVLAPPRTRPDARPNWQSYPRAAPPGLRRAAGRGDAAPARPGHRDQKRRLERAPGAGVLRPARLEDRPRGAGHLRAAAGHDRDAAALPRHDRPRARPAPGRPDRARPGDGKGGALNPNRDER